MEKAMPMEQTSARNTELGREQFVSETEAAEFLNISVRTLQRWRAEPPVGGGPKFYRFGSRVNYLLSRCALWAESRVFNSTSEAS
jgi:hypothetical protein